MDPYERSKLSDALKEDKFERDQFVIREGEMGEKFYFIVEGTAIATKRLNGAQETTTVMEYHSGQYFGERALITNDMRAANIIATSDTLRCLSLERDTFKRLLGPLDDLLKRNMDLYTKFSE
jgi:cAMP-dependent protein kinase regulator